MKDATLRVIEYLVRRYPDLLCCKEDILASLDILIDCYDKNKKLLVCGNGGSATDSQHIVGELMKSFKRKRKLPKKIETLISNHYPEEKNYYIENLERPLQAISLVGETGLITAYSNDKAPDLVFAQQVLGIGEQEDVLLAISTSGNSKNILHACKIAKLMDMKIIGLTGENDGKIKDFCDVVIKAPSKETFIIQEYHLPIYHAICLALEEEYFGEE